MKNLPEFFECDLLGAVIIAKNSDRDTSFVMPTSLGIKKYEGCIEFGIKDADIPTEYWDGDIGDELQGLCNYITRFSDEMCDKVYYDHPEQGEAWLVSPTKNGKDWQWVQIDHKIALISEDD